jgi:hypothetical protein
MMINASTANQLLANAELNVTLDEHSLSRLLDATTPSLFVDALRKAAKDPGAKIWLTNLLDKVRSSTRRSSQKTVPSVVQQERPAPTHVSAPAAAPVNNTAASVAEKPANEREFKGHKVYGAKSALYVGVDETRSGTPTLRIEGAMATSPRNFNWDNKIGIQLTEQELPHVACVLFGWTPQCEYKNHGAAKNKGFKLVIQTKNGKTGLFVNIMEADKPLCAIPVGPVDLYYLRNLALGQLLKKEPSLDSTSIISSLKCLAGMMPNN